MCRPLPSQAFTAQVAGPGACPVPLECQQCRASSLLRVHHLLPSVFVRLALVALAARSAPPGTFQGVTCCVYIPFIPY